MTVAGSNEVEEAFNDEVDLTCEVTLVVYRDETDEWMTQLFSVNVPIYTHTTAWLIHRGIHTRGSFIRSFVNV